MTAARTEQRRGGGIFRAVLAIFLLCATAFPVRADQAPARVMVAAAASTLQALQAAIAAYGPAHSTKVVPIFASSGALAHQIIAGGPAEIYISANSRWMDSVAKARRIVPSSRRVLMANTLVLATLKSSKLEITLKPGIDLRAALKGGRLVTADPDYAPLGAYARAALRWLGAWKGIEKNLVRAADAAQARVLVEQGAVGAGILYASDVQAGRASMNARLKIVAVFPPESHSPAIYEIAMIGKNVAARDFFNWLLGQAGQKILARFGFIPGSKIKVTER